MTLHTLVPRLAPHVRVASDPDGAVILDLRSGRYLVFNAVGSAVVEGVRTGRGMEAVASDLAARCGVPLERVAGDALRFLDRLGAAGLLDRSPLAAGARAEGERVPLVPASAARRSGSPPAPPVPATVSLAWMVPAYLCLALTVAAVKLLGFGRVHRLLRRLSPGTRRPDPVRARRLVMTVDRAASLYVKRVWCLERSLATLVLMRLLRWPAWLVLGVQRMPFEAHAWVELDGQVANDDPRVHRRYATLERC
jgi:transglutaminase superfamily protein/coenzyme PQQ synthesis protein D (PqqD)